MQPPQDPLRPERRRDAGRKRTSEQDRRHRTELLPRRFPAEVALLMRRGARLDPTMVELKQLHQPTPNGTVPYLASVEVKAAAVYARSPDCPVVRSRCR